MSAIYGMIGLKSDLIKEYSVNWKNFYNQYKIDRNEQIFTDSAFFGCGIQYFNNEAKKEILPIYDKERNILFTADCVIDNREDLIELLHTEKGLPDGELLYKAFVKWGTDCFKYLRGVFSFVAYDIKTNEVILAVDHFAQRCLFYHVRNGALYFSTLFSPMFKNTDLKFEENERWLVDTLSVRGPAMITEPCETALKGIYKVVSGTYVKLKLNGIEDNCKGAECRYYEPYSTIKTNNKITLGESEKMVRGVMEKVVGRIIRDDVVMGTQLSRGLDSSSVACQAAKLLAKEGRSLYSFTSVPLKEANLNNKGYIVYDETEGVMKIVEAYPNIIPEFVDTKGRNYVLEARDIIKTWEMPCKSQQNAIWIDEIYKKASQKGCKILLGGATGNCTISAGNIESTVMDHLKHLRICKAIKTMDAVSNVGASRKRFVRVIAKAYLQYYKWYFDNEEKNCYRNIFTRKELGEKYNLTKRFHKDIYHFKPANSMKRMRKEMYMVNANAQIGEIDTKNSLQHGVIIRDPMRSVEMVNLCFSLPMECFASSDYDRRLVREGMKGTVPESTRHDVAHRGRQSGDNLYRIKQVWNEFSDKMADSMDKGYCDKYYDREDVINVLKNMNYDEIETSDNSLLLVDTYSFSLYLEFLHNREF